MDTKIGIMLVALVMVSVAQSAEVYVWKDKHGVISFSDQVSARPDAKQLSIKSPVGSGIELSMDKAVSSPILAEKKKGRRTKRGASIDPAYSHQMDERVDNSAILRQREKCAAWRLKLLNNGQGLRDKVAQDDYDRICVLGMHW